MEGFYCQCGKWFTNDERYESAYLDHICLDHVCPECGLTRDDGYQYNPLNASYCPNCGVV